MVRFLLNINIFNKHVVIIYEKCKSAWYDIMHFNFQYRNIVHNIILKARKRILNKNIFRNWRIENRILFRFIEIEFKFGFVHIIFCISIPNNKGKKNILYIYRSTRFLSCHTRGRNFSKKTIFFSAARSLEMTDIWLENSAYVLSYFSSGMHVSHFLSHYRTCLWILKTLSTVAKFYFTPQCILQ